MSARFIVTLAAPVASRLRLHWRGALTTVVLGVLAVGLLAPSRSLSRQGADGAPSVALPEIPSAGAALMWTDIARAPSETQRRSLGDLLSLLAGLAWIGFGVATVSIFSCHAASARERALDTGVRRAVGASLRQIVLSLCLETVVLAAIALLIGLAFGTAILSVARHHWPGPVAVILAADPAAALAFCAVLGAAGLTSLRLVSRRDLVEPPSQDVGLKVPAYQVAVSVALLMGSAALLANSTSRPLPAPGASASAEIFRIDSGAQAAPSRAAQYGSLLRSVAGLPGVAPVSLTSAGTPLGLGTSDAVTTDCGRCVFGGIPLRWPQFTALVHAVSADTFSALGIRVSAGRAFTDSDTTGAARVAVVNRHLALRYFQGGQAMGRDIFLGPGWPGTPYKVVGIVEDERSLAIGGTMQPRETLYLSILQHPPVHAELLVHYTGSSIAARADPISLALRQPGQSSSVASLGSLAQQRATQQRAGRWIGASLGVSALLVLAMALIGTTATARMWSDSMAWEIALRRGVGATRRRMAGFILLRTAKIAVMGGALGLFFYATVVAPTLAKSMPGTPQADIGLLATAAVLPMLLALLAAVTPGLALLTRPPSSILR